MKLSLLPGAILLSLAAGCSPEVDDSAPSPAAETNADQAGQNISGDSASVPATRASVVPPGGAADQPRLAIDPEGLRWFLPPNGSSRALPFGMAQADVLASLEPVRGEASEGANADCGAGPVEYATWADGLSLVFQNDRFAGWSLDGRAIDAITTADGIGIGATRAELDDLVGPPLEVRQSSLGTEFTAGAYNGLFDSAGAGARITDMWVGVNCVAR